MSADPAWHGPRGFAVSGKAADELETDLNNAGQDAEGI